MLVVFPHIFMADTKLLHGYDFAATLKSSAVIKMLNCSYFFVESGYYSHEYSEPCQTSKIERFGKTVNGGKLLSNF